MELNQHLFELVDIVAINSTHHYNMVDITVEDDESFVLASGIVSHNSAKSQISEARDPNTVAAFALTGKINNVWDCTPAQALSMGKITELLAIIGLTPGKPADRAKLNYGYIIPATDADKDGDDIFTLLACLFFKFWPELFDPNSPPIFYRLVAPNVVASKGGKRIHFTTQADYERVKLKYATWEIAYMKGLGSMSKVDWEMILGDIEQSIIPFVDDGKMEEVMELLFGKNADLRKEWLTTPSE